MRTSVALTLTKIVINLCFLLVLLCPSHTNGQAGINTTAPRASLDVVSANANNVGIILPRVTNNNSLSNSNGNLSLNTTSEELLFKDTESHKDLMCLDQTSVLDQQIEDMENSLSNLSTNSSISDLRIYDNNLFFRDPTDSNYWLSADSELLIFSRVGTMDRSNSTDDRSNLAAADRQVEDDAGYYIPYNFAIIQITACDADGKANRRLHLALQNNVTSSSSGEVIFYDSDIDNRAEQWTDTNDFTRNNSAGRLLARAWRGGSGSDRWDDPIITVEIKQRIQIP